MLADSPKETVKVVFSRSRQEIEMLFTKFDTDGSRSFDYQEFLQLCTALRQNDDGVVSAKDVAIIFNKIADQQRHEVYSTLSPFINSGKSLLIFGSIMNKKGIFNRFIMENKSK